MTISIFKKMNIDEKWEQVEKFYKLKFKPQDHEILHLWNSIQKLARDEERHFEKNPHLKCLLKSVLVNTRLITR